MQEAAATQLASATAGLAPARAAAVTTWPWWRRPRPPKARARAGQEARWLQISARGTPGNYIRLCVAYRESQKASNISALAAMSTPPAVMRKLRVAARLHERCLVECMCATNTARARRAHATHLRAARKVSTPAVASARRAPEKELCSATLHVGESFDAEPRSHPSTRRSDSHVVPSGDSATVPRALQRIRVRARVRRRVRLRAAAHCCGGTHPARGLFRLASASSSVLAVNASKRCAERWA